MIVVTGAAGFIGANLVKGLNARGETNILAVDNLTRGEKFANLVDCEIADYLHKDAFLHELSDGAFDGEIAALFHQGRLLRHDGEQWPLHDGEQLPLFGRAVRTLPARGSAARSMPLRQRFTGPAPTSPRGGSTRLRSTSTATRSSCSMSTCGAGGTSGRRRWSGCAISTSTVRARRTRGAWPRSRFTSSTSTGPMAR